jgi:hypothetical protein
MCTTEVLDSSEKKKNIEFEIFTRVANVVVD